MTTVPPARYLANLAERTAASFVEAFASALVLAGAYDLTTTETAGLAGLMAALTVLRGALTTFLDHRNTDATPRTGFAYLVDVFERAGATFAEAGIAALLMAGTLDLSHTRAAAFAGLTAALAVVKALAARYVGSATTAALLPAGKDLGAARPA